MTDVRRIVAENRRAVLIIAAALLVNAALYVLVVYPLSQRVHTAEQEAGDATRQLVEGRKTFAAARGTVTGKKQADDELQRFYREVLPTDMSAARRVLYPHLDQLARSSNLTTLRYRINPDTTRSGTLRKLTMTMILSGEYTNVRRFIHDLETAPEFLVLENLSVMQAEEGERQLNVTAQVATYYRDGANGN